ncbi:hypothetical protein [Streptomyces sp. SYSU K217416]
MIHDPMHHRWWHHFSQRSNTARRVLGWAELMPEKLASASDLLAQDEIDLLIRALLEWGGPARCSDGLAVGMGFSGMQDLLDQCRRLRAALKEGIPLPPADWARVLLATEIVFVSDLAGTGFEWSTTTGISDEKAIRLLRGIQRKLGKVVRPYCGKRPSV